MLERTIIIVLDGCGVGELIILKSENENESFGVMQEYC
jgi:hypothetical protein